MAEAVEAMALADASVLLSALGDIHTRMVGNIRTLIMLKDKNMETLASPFGMDAESTQRLVLATAELFRLAQGLKAKQKGLEDALTKRNNAQSRRARYDRMRYCTQPWLILSFKQYIKQYKRAQLLTRTRMAKYIAELEAKVESLGEKITVYDDLVKSGAAKASSGGLMAALTTRLAVDSSAGHATATLSSGGYAASSPTSPLGGAAYNPEGFELNALLGDPFPASKFSPVKKERSRSAADWPASKEPSQSALSAGDRSVERASGAASSCHPATPRSPTATAAPQPHDKVVRSPATSTMHTPSRSAPSRPTSTAPETTTDAVTVPASVPDPEAGPVTAQAPVPVPDAGPARAPVQVPEHSASVRAAELPPRCAVPDQPSRNEPSTTEQPSTFLQAETNAPAPCHPTDQRQRQTGVGDQRQVADVAENRQSAEEQSHTGAAQQGPGSLEAAADLLEESTKVAERTFRAQVADTMSRQFDALLDAHPEHEARTGGETRLGLEVAGAAFSSIFDQEDLFTMGRASEAGPAGPDEELLREYEALVEHAHPTTLSELSTDSFGEPRDADRAQRRERLEEARQVLSEAITKAKQKGDGTAAARKVPANDHAQPDRDLQKLGLTGFAFEQPKSNSGKARMPEEHAYDILKEHWDASQKSADSEAPATAA